MARVNIKLVEGMSGMIGDLVFRNVNGTIIVSARPVKRNRKKESKLQQQTREKFRAAAAQVRHKLRDPEVKEHYRQEAQRLKLPNAYTAALKEAMSAG